MTYCPKYGNAPRLGLIALILLAMLTGCGTMNKRSLTTQGPQVACEERAPTEPAYPLPSGSTDWKAWRKAALAWVGIATAEVEKRNTTAACLDRLRTLDVIR